MYREVVQDGCSMGQDGCSMGLGSLACSIWPCTAPSGRAPLHLAVHRPTCPGTFYLSGHVLPGPCKPVCPSKPVMVQSRREIVIA